MEPKSNKDVLSKTDNDNGNYCTKFYYCEANHEVTEAQLTICVLLISVDVIKEEDTSTFKADGSQVLPVTCGDHK